MGEQSDILEPSSQKMNRSAEVLRASIIICTADRGEAIADPVRQILCGSDTSFELIIVDQSKDDSAERALEPFQQDPRLQYHRLSVRGKCRAMNEGIRLAKSDILISTDDDCEPHEGWIEAIIQSFENEPRAGVAFCNVYPGDHDPLSGFVPAYVQQSDQTFRTIADFCAPHGIGAGMAFRRSSILSIGGFDEDLGPGGRFAAYEDADVALRALLNGFAVLHISGARVNHNGFRTWAEGRGLARRDWLGIGAGHAKLLKCGKFSVLRVAVYELWSQALKPLILSVIKLKRPAAVTRLVSYATGFWRGSCMAVDRKSLCFRSSVC
jgi:GT2 family glycosyltransferase